MKARAWKNLELSASYGRVLARRLRRDPESLAELTSIRALEDWAWVGLSEDETLAKLLFKSVDRATLLAAFDAESLLPEAEALAVGDQ